MCTKVRMQVVWIVSVPGGMYAKDVPWIELNRKECISMEIQVNDEKKLVCVWLTREEQEDEQVKQQLEPLYQKYQKQKYFVSVFLSGKQNLYEQTRDLLLYNRRRQAEREVQKQKQASRALSR